MGKLFLLKIFSIIRNSFLWLVNLIVLVVAMNLHCVTMINVLLTMVVVVTLVIHHRLVFSVFVSLVFMCKIQQIIRNAKVWIGIDWKRTNYIFDFLIIIIRYWRMCIRSKYMSSAMFEYKWKFYLRMWSRFCSSIW